MYILRLKKNLRVLENIGILIVTWLLWKSYKIKIHLKALLNHNFLSYINQNYYWGVDINSQKPGSSAMKPGTGFQVCCYFLAFACFLWEAGSVTLTCGHSGKKLKRKSLFLTSFSSFLLVFCFASVIAAMKCLYLTVLLQGWRLVSCHINYTLV